MGDGTCGECSAGDGVQKYDYFCEVAGDYTATCDEVLVNATSEEVGGGMRKYV